MILAETVASCAYSLGAEGPISVTSGAATSGASPRGLNVKAGWVRRSLGDVTTKIGSGATPRGGEDEYKTSGISLIRSLNVYDDGFRDRKLARIDEQQAARLSNVVVEADDVLLNITGASIARCCVAPADFLPARVNQHVAICCGLICPDTSIGGKSTI